MSANVEEETLRAMLWAAVVAQCAGEDFIRVSRIGASLLRTPSIVAFCERAQIDERIRDAADESGTLSFEECAERVMNDLRNSGIVFGAPEHEAMIQKRPIDPLLRPAMNAIIARHGKLAISPLALLLEIVRVEPALAERLALRGLTEAVIRSELSRV